MECVKCLSQSMLNCSFPFATSTKSGTVFPTKSVINLNVPACHVTFTTSNQSACVNNKTFRYLPTHASTITPNSRNLVMVTTAATD